MHSNFIHISVYSNIRTILWSFSPQNFLRVVTTSPASILRSVRRWKSTASCKIFRTGRVRPLCVRKDWRWARNCEDATSIERTPTNCNRCFRAPRSRHFCRMLALKSRNQRKNDSQVGRASLNRSRRLFILPEQKWEHQPRQFLTWQYHAVLDRPVRAGWW